MVDEENLQTKSGIAKTSENASNSTEFIDRTLAEQIAADEHQMYLRSQQHLHEIEDEVIFFFIYLF